MAQDIILVGQKFFHKNVKKEQKKSASHKYLLLISHWKKAQINQFGTWTTEKLRRDTSSKTDAVWADDAVW